MQEPYGAFTWYPANDQPSDKALYDIAITVPDGWAGIAVGKYQKETATGPHGLPLTYWYRPGKETR